MTGMRLPARSLRPGLALSRGAVALSAAARPALRWPPAGAILARALLAGVLGCLLVQPVFALFVAQASLALSVVDPPVTALMLHRAATADAPIKPISFVPLERLPWRAGAMFVAVEDHTFYRHNGIDLQAIRDAIRVNHELGRITYGGSTITMQLARTLFLTPHRTYVRKYFEALAALTMELVLSKERILELYINTIEYGRGLYGITAAARRYYGREPERLTTDEYRRLVTIVASPLLYDVTSFARRRALAERYEFLLSVFP